MIRHLLAWLVVLALWGPSGLAGPTGGGQANDEQAAELYRQAKSAGKADVALATVKKALDLSPDHLGANLLLAGLLLDKQQLGPSIKQVAKVKALLAGMSDPLANARSDLEELEKRLARQRWPMIGWQAMTQQFADRYKSAGEGAGAGSASAAVAFSRAAKLKPRDQHLATLAERAAAGPDSPQPETAPDPERARVSGRQADPKSKQVADIDAAFSTAAKALAERARSAGDTEVADEIEGLLKELALSGASVEAARPAATVVEKALPGPPNLAGKINLLSGAAKVQCAAPANMWECRRDHLLVLPYQPDPRNPTAIQTGVDIYLTLSGLTVAGDCRVRWRVECTQSGAWGATIGVILWPMGEPDFPVARIEADGAQPKLTGARVLRSPYAVRLDEAAVKAAGRGGAVCDVCWEKRGNEVAIWVNSAKGVDIQLAPGQLAQLASKPMRFHFSRAGTAGVKFTLAELLLGRNLPAYQPPGKD